ncbi:hypothetical protein EC1011_3687 [Escherichia coli 101-1]|nr:hypothetical protein EC1011_3687 [Escherichia coli 101-1]
MASECTLLLFRVGRYVYYEWFKYPVKCAKIKLPVGQSF